LALVAVASTVNFALRTPAEQQGLVASFGHYLHSLSAPVQILIRAHRLDLSAQISELRQGCGELAHPLLEAAALEHADYLTQLGEQSDLLRRQVLLVFREALRPAGSVTDLGGRSPWLARGRRRAGASGERAGVGARRAAETRLVRRLGDAIELLAPAGIVVTALDVGQASAVLAAACNPDTLLPLSGGLAGAQEVITTAASSDLIAQDGHAGWRHDYCAGSGDDGDYDDEGDDLPGWGRDR
jgi:hypothetical protein